MPDQVFVLLAGLPRAHAFELSRLPSQKDQRTILVRIACTLDGPSIDHVMLSFLHKNLILLNGLGSSFESPGVASKHIRL
jgi:hypothetical protein